MFKGHRYMPIEERFWAQVHKTESCWDWTGLKDKDGYGRIRHNGKQTRAHRLSYIFHHGEIPDNMAVLHSCDRPCCVNPDHLSLGTFADNNNDRREKGRSASGDNNGSRLHPEKRIRGEAHWWAKGNEAHPQGENNGRAKLTEAQVREIRALWETGRYTKRGLGRQFSVSDTIIYKVVTRQLWAHVEDGGQNE